VFERFTESARRVLVLAQEEARLLHHNFIGTEHILLGLVREGEGVGAQVLANLGTGLPVVRQRVMELLSADDVPEPPSVAAARRANPAPARVLEAAPPLCPGCSSSLAGNLRYARVAAKAADPEGPETGWTFVYCETCGHALGLAAGGSTAGHA
jgi:Clp amino terminal domain, pathogenicity island component